MSTQANYSPVLPQAGSIPGQINFGQNVGTQGQNWGGQPSEEEEPRVTYQPNYVA